MANKIGWLPCGSHYETDDSHGNWKLTFPNGKSERGNAPTQKKAEEAALARYKDWVFGQWMQGEGIGRGRFSCPLK